MSTVYGYHCAVKFDLGNGALPLVPPLRLDLALHAIFNDLTCTTSEGKPNQKNLPQEMTYLGGNGNLGIWKIKSTDIFREHFQKTIHKARQAIPLFPPSNSLGSFNKNFKDYLEAAAAKAGCEPTHAALLAELKKVDLSAHPLFFDAVRDNYIDVFRLDIKAFKPWLQQFDISDRPHGVVYLMDFEALKPIAEYLENQPLTSEVHTINWLYGAAVCAFYLEEIADTLKDEEPQDVSEELQEAVEEATLENTAADNQANVTEPLPAENIENSAQQPDSQSEDGPDGDAAQP